MWGSLFLDTLTEQEGWCSPLRLCGRSSRRGLPSKYFRHNVRRKRYSVWTTVMFAWSLNPVWADVVHHRYRQKISCFRWCQMSRCEHDLTRTEMFVLREHFESLPDVSWVSSNKLEKLPLTNWNHFITHDRCSLAWRHSLAPSAAYKKKSATTTRSWNSLVWVTCCFRVIRVLIDVVPTVFCDLTVCTLRFSVQRVRCRSVWPVCQSHLQPTCSSGVS